LGAIFSRLFTNGWYTNTAIRNSPYDLFASADLIYNANFLFGTETDFINWQTGASYSSYLDWITPMLSTRGFTTAEYTGKFSLEESAFYDIDQAVTNGGYSPVPPPAFLQMILLSDGTCASACCQFSSRMIDAGVAKTVVWGGINGLDIETSSVCGGAVKDWDLFASPLFTTTADLTFNFQEFFLRSQLGIPREWFRLSPDFRLTNRYSVIHSFIDIYQSSFDEYVALLDSAASFFPQVGNLNSLSPSPSPPATGSTGTGSAASTLSSSLLHLLFWFL